MYVCKVYIRMYVCKVYICTYVRYTYVRTYVILEKCRALWGEHNVTI